MKTYSDYLASIFPGEKIQKLSIDAGFTCPNRDGSISTGGCIYCRNDSFTPSYCKSSDSIKEQINKGRNFFSRKYPKMKFLAYFQSYTGTYNKSIKELSEIYKEALEPEDVVGMIVATRPDCLSDSTLALLEELNQTKTVFIEFGAETSHNDTLKLINRNHTWDDLVLAVNKTASKRIRCGIHLIAGLPGEDKQRILETIDQVITLPIQTIKLHQLQVLIDTPLWEKIKKREISIPEFTLDEYINLCAEIVKKVPDNIVIERFLSQSPPELVSHPSWGLKNYQFMTKLANLLKQ